MGRDAGPVCRCGHGLLAIAKTLDGELRVCVVECGGPKRGMIAANRIVEVGSELERSAEDRGQCLYIYSRPHEKSSQLKITRRWTQRLSYASNCRGNVHDAEKQRKAAISCRLRRRRSSTVKVKTGDAMQVHPHYPHHTNPHKTGAGGIKALQRRRGRD